MLDSLADLPFAAQRAWLDQRLAAGDDPGTLLAAVAPLPDHGPLGHLLARLVASDALAAPSLHDALAALVREGAETAVQVALRALPPQGSPPVVVDLVARTLAGLPLARIAVTALGLRWLRDADPARHQRLRAEAVGRCVEAIARGMEPPDSALLLAPGPELAALPEAPREQARLARERLAPRLLAAIGAAPRSLAQVNAEELLARRVYERSGHFLFELIQNADDARASRLALALAPDELTLRHDGTPFDPLDVLGVLSVGLSTKDAGAIGMFGVGFRSVYAVTERPQIHSGPFRFEISGMARPRTLAARPDVTDAETLISLPLDRPGARAAPVADEAAALPAEVLLTLRHLRQLDLGGPSLAPRSLSLSLSLAGETARLNDLVSGTSIQYRLARHDQALVAWQVDAAGRPLPRPAHSPSLYCFLPTREDTGLPVLIHAPFVVPVDRERLRHDDPRNQALLADAARALAALVASLDRAHTPAALALLAAARPPRAFAPVLDATRQQLATAPLLTDAAGQPVAARHARLLPPALASALAGVPLDAPGRRALAASTDAAVARWLGVEDFTARDLLALTEQRVGAAREGDPAPVPWLASTLALGVTLGTLTDHADRGRRDALPWVIVDGACWRADSVRLATSAQRSLYDGARPLLDLADGHPDELAAAGLRWLTDREIVADLLDPDRRAGLRRRDDALLDYLGQLGPSLLAGLGSLPLFATADGGWAPLVGSDAVFAAVADDLGVDLAVMPAAGPPRVRADVSERHGALLRALGGRTLGWSELLGWWRSHTKPGDMGPIHALLRAADEAWRRWPPARLTELLSTPLFVDRTGGLRPLLGPDAALLPADETIAELLPWKPWLEPSEPQRSLSLLASGAVRRLGAADLVEALLGEGPLATDGLVDAIDVAALAAYLAPRVGSLPASLVGRLARAPLWRASDGSRQPASALALGDELAALLDDPDALTIVSDAASLLHPDDVPRARSLRAFFGFRSAITLLADEVRRQARPGRPLAEQPAWMASLDRLVRLGAIARTHEQTGWPVALTADGLVTAQPPWLADEDERLLASLTPLGARLADHAWALRQEAFALPPLPAWRLLDALAPLARERVPASTSALTPRHRDALHRWLLGRDADIEAHPQARGLLGQLHAFLAADGSLRAPSGLLLATGLDALDLPGRPDPSVPAPLRSWLAQLFQLDEASVAPLFASLIEGAAVAAEADDRTRLDRTLLALATAVDTLAHEATQADRVERSLRTGRASRRLRFPASDGSRQRARDVLLDEGESYERVLTFHRNPPPRFAGPPALRALAERLGAPALLSADELRAHLAPAGRRPGLESSVALACYVAQAATATPALRDALDLDRAAWVPAADGSLHRPSGLFWPAPELAPLVGPRPDRVVHPRLAGAAPATLARWLRFRTPSDVSVVEVVQGLRDRSNEPDAAWSWLDEALRDGRASNLRAHGLSLAQLPTPERFPRLVRELTPPPASTRSSSPPSASVASNETASPPPASETAPRRSLWSRLFGRDEPAPPPEPSAPPPAPPPPRRSPAIAEPPDPTPAGPSRAARRAARSAARTGRESDARHASGGDESGAAPDRSAASEGWYRPRGELAPQLGKTSGWLASRKQAARHGFVLSPGSLPVPYLYAPSLLVTRFDAATQGWQGGEAKRAWMRPGPGVVSTVSFAGSLGAGETVLPCPVFASIEEAWLDDEPLTLRTTAEGLTVTELARPGAVRFTATLRAAPRFVDDPDALPAPRSLLAAMTPDAELPRELHTFVASVLAAGSSPLARALGVRDLVRTRYRYDLSYLEDDRLGRSLARATAGSAHRHLAALHAGRDGEFLGAGVCYELNTLVCELLRRVGVPAALSAGWVLDQGHIDEPDHLWALALVASDQGPRWMPLDASLGRDDQPQTFPRRPPVSARVADRRPSAPLPAAPSWDRTAAPPHRPAAPPARPGNDEPLPVTELLRAARYLARQLGDGAPDEEALRAHVRRLLADPALSRRLWELLRGR